jgi:hypothetical protein
MDQLCEARFETPRGAATLSGVGVVPRVAPRILLSAASAR